MFLSSLYHTFNCRSEKDCDLFLAYDLFGIALSLLAIYTSGIYYAFWCNQVLLIIIINKWQNNKIKFLGLTIFLFNNSYIDIYVCHDSSSTKFQCKHVRKNECFRCMGCVWSYPDSSLELSNGWL